MNKVSLIIIDAVWGTGDVNGLKIVKISVFINMVHIEQERAKQANVRLLRAGKEFNVTRFL